MIVRAAHDGDLAAIAAIQQASPEAAQWNPADYLRYDTAVALCESRVAGFLASRVVAPDECEILNIAVAPEFRRRGVARTLLCGLIRTWRGTVFLEVRESNQAAQNLYKSLGFQAVAVRPGYYSAPAECGIVLKFHSCYRGG
jgi:ribosomal-protein-alanine N-acetyltransferase